MATHHLVKRLPMDPFIHLPNGTIILASTVISIRPLPSSGRDLGGWGGGIHRARVVVTHGGGSAEVCLANDDDHAAEMAKEIHQQVMEKLNASK